MAKRAANSTKEIEYPDEVYNKIKQFGSEYIIKDLYGKGKINSTTFYDALNNSAFGN